MNNVYPLVCLQEASDTIYRIADEMPKLRKLVEQYRVSEPKKALELIKLLGKYKTDLMEQLGTCRSSFDGRRTGAAAQTLRHHPGAIAGQPS